MLIVSEVQSALAMCLITPLLFTLSVYKSLIIP